MKSMKKVYSCVLALICCFGFAACGDKEGAAPEVTTTAATTTKAPETTTTTTTKKEETTTAKKKKKKKKTTETGKETEKETEAPKEEAPAESGEETVESAHFTAKLDGSKWFTEDKPDDAVVQFFGMSYKWTAQKDEAKPSMVQFGPILDDFSVESLNQEMLNGETDMYKIFLMIAESRGSSSEVERQISEVEEHSGMKVSHLRSYIASRGRYTDEFIFFAGGAMNEIMVDYTDDAEGKAAYDDIVASVIDKLTVKE